MRQGIGVFANAQLQGPAVLDKRRCMKRCRIVCQIHRFLVLHKELDADDGELTRTRKVRRNIIAEKFDDLITALYDGSPKISTVTEVTYEDGRKGSIKATLEIRDVRVVDRRHRMAAE